MSLVILEAELANQLWVFGGPDVSRGLGLHHRRDGTGLKATKTVVAGTLGRVVRQALKLLTRGFLSSFLVSL